MQREAVTKLKQAASPQSVIRHIAVAVIALIISMTRILGKPSPFCASFTAAMSGIDCVSAFLGSVAGYFFTGDFENCVTVCSALMATVAVRLIASRSQSRIANTVSAVTAGTATLFATAMTSHSVSELLSCVALGVMAGGGAFVMLRLRSMYRKRELVSLTLSSDTVGMASVITAGVIASSVLSSYSIGIFNIGVIFSCCVSLLAAMRYQSGKAAICASALAFGVALNVGELYALCMSLPVGAAVAGTFHQSRKFSCAGAFILVFTLCTALTVTDNSGLALIANAFMGSAVFMLMPAFITNDNADYEKISQSEADVKALFKKRLQFAKGAILDVRRTLGLTADKLEKKRDISWVSNTACDKICRRCRYNMQCWGKEYGDSTKQFSTLVTRLKSGERLDGQMFSQPLYDRCPQKRELCDKLTTLFEAYTSAENERRRISRMREILSAQLSCAEQMLDSFGEDADGGEVNSELNKTAHSVLLRLGCEDVSAVCVDVREGAGMSLEAYSEKGFYASREEICEAMGYALGQRFELPVISKINDSYKLSMFSKTTYCLNIEISQISKNEGTVCGDYCESFINSKGVAYIVLSDGMGSGARARVDSSFACGMLIRLLKAGIGIEAALGIINTSVSLKSSDESFATLEICSIDLYSGETCIYKAGSANTYIKCGRKFAKLSCKGLPMGCRDYPVYDRRCFTVGNRDIIVMTSDGAELNEKWLYREMDKPVTDLKEFSKTVAQTAKFYAGDGKSDDISVIAMQLSR